MTQSVLDPEVANFVAKMQAAWRSHPPFLSLSPSEARVVAEQVREPWRQGGPVMAHTSEHSVETPTGSLRIRIYDPDLPAPAPALIYLHGGGFVLFSIDTHDRLMREYAAAGGFRVIGVDYPLSPETRYPVALEQTIALIDWLGGDGGPALGIDPARLVIGGDSAGGNIALATALRLRDRGSANLLRGVLLNYGGFGAIPSDEIVALYGGPGAVLERSEMDYYFESYVGAAGHAIDDPYARPIIADLHDLPPAFLVIPECDILSEQSHAMAARMREAGVAVASKVYPGATHSFLEAMSVAEVARDAIADGAGWVRERLS